MRPSRYQSGKSHEIKINNELQPLLSAILGSLSILEFAFNSSTSTASIFNSKLRLQQLHQHPFNYAMPPVELIALVTLATFSPNNTYFYPRSSRHSYAAVSFMNG